MRCPPCGGYAKWPTKMDICPVCRGEGELPDVLLEQPICRVCNGKGTFPTDLDLCPRCGGTGRKPLSDDERLQVLMVEAGKPRTAHLKVHELFRQMTGEVIICDPYLGVGSLVQLDALAHCGAIRFLTRVVDPKSSSVVASAVKGFVTERPHFEFRIHSATDLHDRYLRTDDQLVIIGHGLKDLGVKDSFVIRLPNALCPDLSAQVKATFCERWNRARPYP